MTTNKNEISARLPLTNKALLESVKRQGHHRQGRQLGQKRILELRVFIPFAYYWG